MSVLKRKYRNGFQCDMCLQEFKSNQGMSKHYNAKHRGKFHPRSAPEVRSTPWEELPPSLNNELSDYDSDEDVVLADEDAVGLEADDEVCNENLVFKDFEDATPHDDDSYEESPASKEMIPPHEQMCIALADLAEKYHLSAEAVESLLKLMKSPAWILSEQNKLPKTYRKLKKIVESVSVSVTKAFQFKEITINLPCDYPSVQFRFIPIRKSIESRFSDKTISTNENMLFKFDLNANREQMFGELNTFFLL